MDTLLIILTAVNAIFKEQYDLPEDVKDKYFIGDVILRIAEVLMEDGSPTTEMRNKSIEIGELTEANCQDGHVTLRAGDQLDQRNAESLRRIAYRVKEDCRDNSPVADVGSVFAFDVCQACPAFIEAVHKIHTTGLTPDVVIERAKAYWLTTFGWWA